MFLQRVKTPGLAHLSYIIGSKGEAAVIDPRRDVEDYIRIAKENGCRITLIFETHRNEDLISGASILADLTGAKVLHGPNPDGKMEYATLVAQGDTFEVGNICLEVLETPGHTKDSISILLFDTEFSNGPVGIFTGDTLFIGDVGRADFYPDQAREVAGMLFDSLRLIQQRAPDAIVYPAHGAGSVCGDGMADREFSTVAHEMKNNPMLQIQNRDSFIAKKVEEHHYQAPYFSEMERVNLKGASGFSQPKIICPRKLSSLTNEDNGYLIDIRSVESYLGAHYPGSYCLPLAMVTAYGGWLFRPDDKLTFIADDETNAAKAAMQFARIGYDNTRCYVPASLAPFAASGGKFDSIEAVDAKQVSQMQAKGWQLLDVRKVTEYQQGHIEGSKHVFLGHLPDQLAELNKDDKYLTLCASGIRATVAAGYLKTKGFDNVKVFMGSMGAWKAEGLPIKKA